MQPRSIGQTMLKAPRRCLHAASSPALKLPSDLSIAASIVPFRWMVNSSKSTVKTPSPSCTNLQWKGYTVIHQWLKEIEKALNWTASANADRARKMSGFFLPVGPPVGFWRGATTSASLFSPSLFCHSLPKDSMDRQKRTTIKSSHHGTKRLGTIDWIASHCCRAMSQSCVRVSHRWTSSRQHLDPQHQPFEISNTDHHATVALNTGQQLVRPKGGASTLQFVAWNSSLFRLATGSLLAATDVAAAPLFRLPLILVFLERPMDGLISMTAQVN